MIAVNWEIAITQSNKWKDSGKTIVFTNGCYDLIHAGHIDLLANAKNKGAVSYTHLTLSTIYSV